MVPDSPAAQKDFSVTVFSQEGDNTALEDARLVKLRNSRSENKQFQEEFRGR